MKKFDHLDTISYPVVTEKATNLSEQNKVVFKVDSGVRATVKILLSSVCNIFPGGHGNSFFL